jgi:uncharacterized protein
MKAGIISDTHGSVHKNIHRLFKGVDQIVHAGDIGGKGVLEKLKSIAPVIAVRGNYDTEPELQPVLLNDPSGANVCGLRTLLTHRLVTIDWDIHKELIADMIKKGGDPPRMMIFGHTHYTVMEEVKGIFFVNPGYCGPDPIEGPPTAALLEILGNDIKGEIFDLDKM